MNRMIRWPARMLAKRRTESEISRMKFDRNSRMKTKPFMNGLSIPSGIRLLR